MKIEGRIIEVTEGEECDSIKVLSGKAKSVIKMDVGNAERFEIGANVRITVDVESMLFNRDTGEISEGTVNAVRALGEHIPEGNTATYTTPDGQSATIKGRGKKT